MNMTYRKKKLRKSHWEITFIKAKNVRNKNGGYKPDMFGLGISCMSIYSDDSDCDIFVMFLFWGINIHYTS